MTKSKLKSILSYVLIAILIFTTTPGGSAEENNAAIPTGTVPYTFDVDWGDLELIPIGAEFKVSISEKHSGKVHTKIATHNTGWNCTFYLDPNLEYDNPRVQTYAFYPAIEKTGERQYKIAVNAHNLGESWFHYHWKTLTFEVQGDVTSKEDRVQLTITPRPLYGETVEPRPITVTITKENNWRTNVLVPSLFLIENTGSYGYYSYENEGIVPQVFPDLDSVAMGHYDDSTHFVVEYKPGNGSNSYDIIYSMLEPQPTPPAYGFEISTDQGDGHSNDNSGNSDQNNAQNNAQNNDPSNNSSSNQGDGMNSGNSGSGSTDSGNNDSGSTNDSSSSEIAQTPSTPPTTTTSTTIATTATTGTTTASTTTSSTSAATAASSNLSTAVSESTMQSLESNRDVSEDDEEDYEYAEDEEYDLEEIDENDPARGAGKRRKKKTSTAAVGNATTASGLDAVAANVTALPYTANLPNELFFAVGAFLSVLGLLGIFLEKLRL